MGVATVIVVGAINIDYVVAAPHMPAPGETVVGEGLQIFHGGKGANAAVAAARAADVNSRVFLVGAVGDDTMGPQASSALKAENVDVTHVLQLSDVSTGAALITVDAKGENQITLGPGANGQLSAEQVERALGLLLPQANIVLVSAEIPYAAIAAAVRLAKAAGVSCVLNPAPVIPDIEQLLTPGILVTPNQIELRDLVRSLHRGAEVESDTEVASPPAVESYLQLLFQSTRMPVVTTLGSQGCAVMLADGMHAVGSYFAGQVVDTTGAGDTFNGVLCMHLAEGAPIFDATRAATVAAGLSVTVSGAREGMPTKKAIAHAMATYID